MLRLNWLNTSFYGLKWLSDVMSSWHFTRQYIYIYFLYAQCWTVQRWLWADPSVTGLQTLQLSVAADVLHTVFPPVSIQSSHWQVGSCNRGPATQSLQHFTLSPSCSFSSFAAPACWFIHDVRRYFGLACSVTDLQSLSDVSQLHSGDDPRLKRVSTDTVTRLTRPRVSVHPRRTTRPFSRSTLWKCLWCLTQDRSSVQRAGRL